MPREHPLAGVERALRVAPRHRLDLVEEMDADLRGLQAELERRGLATADARREAIRRLVPADGVVGRLEDRYLARAGRWMRRTAWADRATSLSVGTAAALAGVSAVIATGGPATSGASAVLAWPLVTVFALLAVNLAGAAVRLWLHGDLRSERRQLLWARQAGLIVTAVALGALGAAWEGHQALSAAEYPARSVLAAWEVAGRMAYYAGTGLAAAIFGLFGWLVIAPRLIADAEIERRIAAFFAPSRPGLMPDASSTPSNRPKGEPRCRS